VRSFVAKSAFDNIPTRPARPNTLTILIKPIVRYNIAARLLDSRYARGNEHWEAVVWETKETESYANQTTENVDTSFTAIKNQVISVVRAISRVEQKKHGNTNHIQFSVDIPANNVATLGLMLDNSISDELAQKGFLVTAVQEHSVGAM
jgi:hypothetical protein